MKKVLLAIPGNSSFLKPSILTFEKLGWDVKNVDYRKTDFIAALKNNLKLTSSTLREIREEERPSVKRVINNNEILRVARLWRPNLFLTFKGEIILPKTIVALKQLGIKTINWYPDYISPEINSNRDLIRAYDHFVYWDKWNTNDLQKRGFENVFYLPFCTIPSETPAPKRKKYPINFVANFHQHRAKKIEPIIDMGLYVWGNKAWADTNFKNNYHGGPIEVEEMIKIIRLSKITLNVHVVENVYSEGTNVRTFEATGAGGFLLVNRRESLYELFDVGREIEIFESNEELIEKTKFYLKNERAREKIALAGWRRTSRDHTYQKRFSVLLKYLNI